MAASPIVLQSTTSSVAVFLQLADTGAPATGLTFANVTCKIKKPGAGVFSVKVLDGTNFTEISDGFYELDFTTAETNTLGTIYVLFTGATVDTTVLSVTVVSAFTSSPTTTTGPTTTVMYGYVFKPDGSPYSGATVSVRTLSDPTVLHNGTEGLVLSTSASTTSTDASGYFAIPLVTGSQVDLFISAANFRRSFTVPGVSTNVFDLP